MRNTVVSVFVCALVIATSAAPVTSPAGPNSAQPQLSVSSRGVLLSWIERAGATAALKFSERTATGWTPAATVASGTDWFVNWADVPSVIRLSNGTLAAHWLQKSGADTYAYDVRLAYSKDNGKTWSKSFLPHSDGTKTEHGFASLIEMPGGSLGMVWLDGRAMTPGAGEHAGHGGGAMSVRFASFDTNWKQTAESLVDDRVCECCPTTIAVTSEGAIAAYRNRSETEVRDIHVSRLVNGKWMASAAVHADNWEIDACPVNGPALAASGRNVALAWFTGVNGQNRAFVAFSKDAGKTFGDPIRVDEGGTLGRVDAAMLPNGDAIVTWIERAGSVSDFRWRRVSPNGNASAPVTVSAIASTRSSGYPRMAIAGNTLTFAWVDTATSKVLTAEADVK
ncbi:MAG: exo-alpha-sialidase [Acidobacteria bacterium]|nr:MAG: exo-alpha-sialidase [Acidobacteriota bacterium]